MLTKLKIIAGLFGVIGSCVAMASPAALVPYKFQTVNMSCKVNGKPISCMPVPTPSGVAAHYNTVTHVLIPATTDGLMVQPALRTGYQPGTYPFINNHANVLTCYAFDGDNPMPMSYCQDAKNSYNLEHFVGSYDAGVITFNATVVSQDVKAGKHYNSVVNAVMVPIQ